MKLYLANIVALDTHVAGHLVKEYCDNSLKEYLEYYSKVESQNKTRTPKGSLERVEAKTGA